MCSELVGMPGFEPGLPAPKAHPHHRQTSPDMRFTCDHYRRTWSGVALCLPLLAPNLAPSDIVSSANLRRGLLPKRPPFAMDPSPPPKPSICVGVVHDRPSAEKCQKDVMAGVAPVAGVHRRRHADWRACQRRSATLLPPAGALRVAAVLCGIAEQVPGPSR